MRNVSLIVVFMDFVVVDKCGKIYVVGVNVIVLSILLLGKMYVLLYVLLIYDVNEFYIVYRV